MTELTKINGYYHLDGYPVRMSKEASPNFRVSASGYLLVSNDEYNNIAAEDQATIDRLGREAAQMRPANG